ncbi:hypothetical protein ACFX1R_015492 [Malus domestica]
MGASKPSPLIPETPADSQQLKGSLIIHLQNQISFAFSCLLLQGALISGSTWCSKPRFVFRIYVRSLNMLQEINTVSCKSPASYRRE